MTKAISGKKSSSPRKEPAPSAPEKIGKRKESAAVARGGPATASSGKASAAKGRRTADIARGSVSRSPDAATAPDEQKLVNTLARGLSVLSIFRTGDGPLGNAEIAARTGLPKPTVSRLTKTLTQLGYLNNNRVQGNYELGYRTLALGYVALSNLDVRRLARPYMQELADISNLNVGLGVRDKLMMLHVETCDGQALIGLRLYPGSRMPIMTTAMGRAYLALVSEGERISIMEAAEPQYGDDWPTIRRGIEQAIRDMKEKGFCLSVGDWRKDINGVGSAVAMPDGRGVYAFNIGGPAYLAPPDVLENDYGPRLARMTQELRRKLGAMG